MCENHELAVSSEVRGAEATSATFEYNNIELCRFRFLKNLDSESSALFNNLSGIGTGIGIEKKKLFSSSQFLF